MFRNKAIKMLIVAFGGVMLLTTCYKDRTVIPDAAEVTRTVSFSQDIIPILNKSCNISGCHSSGGQVPNLSASNAYNSLINGNYVDKSNPSNSIIYQKMSGKRGIPMPVSGINSDYNALILAWIKQGAANN